MPSATQRVTSSLFARSDPLDPSTHAAAVLAAQAQGIREPETWPGLVTGNGDEGDKEPGLEALDGLGALAPVSTAVEPTVPSNPGVAPIVALGIAAGSVLALALVLVVVKSAERRSMEQDWRPVAVMDVTSDPQAVRSAAQTFIARHSSAWARNPWEAPASKMVTMAGVVEERAAQALAAEARRRQEDIERAAARVREEAAAAAREQEAARARAQALAREASARSRSPRPRAGRGGLRTLKPKRVRASSFWAKRRERHPAEHAFDGKMKTAWNEGAPGSGEGEWIEARFSGPMTFRRIVLSTGYDDHSRKFGDLFYANSHLKRVRIEFDGAPIDLA